MEIIGTIVIALLVGIVAKLIDSFLATVLGQTSESVSTLSSLPRP